MSSSSAYRLRNRAGAESFARAWDSALRLAVTRLGAIAVDRAINGRVERFYKDGELTMERRIPSDYLLTWLLSRLDPLQFGSPTAQALAAAGDPREKSRKELPALIAAFADVPADECACEPIDFLDDRLGETGSGDPIGERGSLRTRARMGSLRSLRFGGAEPLAGRHFVCRFPSIGASGLPQSA